METHSRRDLFRITAAAIATGSLAAQENHPAATAFFTPDEFRMVDELSEIIIPADEHSPGARAAKVAAYIDKGFAEAFDQEAGRKWREGLKLVDSLSQEMNGTPFLAASPEARVALLTRMSKNERRPEKPEEHFFSELKHTTAHAYYTSKIGIHQEIEYKGNVLLEEFEGFDATLVPLTVTDSQKQG